MGGQGEAFGMRSWLRPAPKREALKSAALAGLICLGLGGPAPAAERSTPSGLPVPRYVTLKFGQVNARAGPGDDHRLLWVYRVRGLPVQVVAETSEWRRICDPTGGLVWVHKRTTDGRRAVINMSRAPVTLFRKPKDTAKPAAYLNSRSLAALDRCDKGWCKVSVDGRAGWVREGALWGTAEAPQCR
jgi:SH3-like domain-containing protein